MRALLRFYTEGREISLDRTQQYTFHLPRTVLCEHAEIVEFFQALRSLYYGLPDSYIACLARMSTRPAATVEASLS